MKLTTVSAGSALLAAAIGLVGCSSDQNEPKSQSGKDASIGFHLLASNGVTLSSASYDLNTQAGANVIDGSIPVPNDDSEISLGIRNLSAGQYVLAFSATGSYQGKPVPCVSSPVNFALTAGQQLTLPTITLTCKVTNQVDNSAGVDASVTVAVETITIGSVIETFTYGPRTVKGHNNTGGICQFPPVALHIANASGSATTYSWTAAPDGSFTGTPVDGTYQCVSGGNKTLTLTAVNGGVTSTKSVTVNCDDSICRSGAICGDGTVQTGEQCDEMTARCTNCQITPVCGDGHQDAPEQCDAVNLPTATCDINCHSITPATCGDGTVNQASEQCDNGTANSDTAPNACRTNCKNPSCGDNVTDTGEACDSGAANSDTAPNACRTTCQLPKCGDGVVDSGEQCDATMLPTPNCSATCQTVTAAKHVACESCIGQDDYDATIQASCSGNARCIATEDCVIDAGCFNPIPALCYCGVTDAGLCKQDTFKPTGPCKTQILDSARGASDSWVFASDGSVPAGVSSLVLQRYFSTVYPLGVAMNLINDAATTDGEAGQCLGSCF